MPRNDYTVEGRLVGHVVLGRDLLLEQAARIPDFPADLRLQLEHLVLSHQGRREFGAVVEPMTAEALVLHMVDDLDAKLNQLRAAAEKGGGLAWVKGLGRHVYLGPAGEPGTPSEPAEGAPAGEGPAEDAALEEAAPADGDPQPALF
jgi:3'-5' exoribonuclease